MNHFDNQFIVWIDVQNRDSNMIFNTSIRDNDSKGMIKESLESNVVKILDMTLDISKV